MLSQIKFSHILLRLTLLVEVIALIGCAGPVVSEGEPTRMNDSSATPANTRTPAPLSSPRPTTPVVDQPDPGTGYVPEGYHLVFNDEFDGDSLDTVKWNTLAPWRVQWYADSLQKQAFILDAVSLQNGLARFTAQPANGDLDANGQPYISGGITSNGTFTYGYYEARVKVPAGKGLWPAFWLTSSTRWPPEWDIFEIIDGINYGFPHPLSGGKCTWVEGAAGQDSTYFVPDQYGLFHIYGFLWTPSDVFWYVDSVLTEHYAIEVETDGGDPFWWAISLQVGGSWPGDPDSSTTFPATMDVDYMRLYQK
jgi:beta-glucanase (GH16 family)